MVSEAEAVEALTELGLSDDEAQCFVALTELSTGTAREISNLAGVPQSRVYDVTEQLHDEGLIDIQQSDPKKYFRLPIERYSFASRTTRPSASTVTAYPA